MLNLTYMIGMVVSSFVMLFSKSLLIIWMQLEMMLFFFLALIINENNIYSYYKFSNWVMCSQVYFIFNISGSLVMLFGLNLNFKIYLINFGLIIKLGLFPVFWWVPLFVLNSNWYIIFIFLTINKMGSLLLLILFSLNQFLYYLIIWNLVFSLFYLLNSINYLKFIIMWSSLIDNSLMMLISFMNLKSFFFFFFFYTLLLYLICYYMSLIDYWGMQNLNWLNYSYSLSLSLVLVGLPPLFSFIYKCMFLNSLMNWFFKYNLVLIYVMMIMLFIQSLTYFFYFWEFSSLIMFNINSVKSFNFFMILMLLMPLLFYFI